MWGALERERLVSWYPTDPGSLAQRYSRAVGPVHTVCNVSL